jgi:hypothetical protein
VDCVEGRGDLGQQMNRRRNANRSHRKRQRRDREYWSDCEFSKCVACVATLSRLERECG